jgi:hypothetical protein
MELTISTINYNKLIRNIDRKIINTEKKAKSLMKDANEYQAEMTRFYIYNRAFDTGWMFQNVSNYLKSYYGTYVSIVYDPVYYTKFQEFGTIHIRPKMFMYDASKDAIVYIYDRLSKLMKD